MGRHIVSILVIWVVLAALGELLLLVPLFPTVGSESAKEFDDIFRFLLYLGIPVFMLVVTVVGYGIFVWRSKGPDGDGPAFRGEGLIPKVWLLVTGGLAVFVMIYPGLTGLAELQAKSDGNGWGEEEAEVVVDVQAFQFSFSMTYVNEGFTVNVAQGGELVLPVDTRARFNVTSTDVVHSFWIPAFRLKIDAIPGRTTFFTVEPDKLGNYDDDAAYRVQCAELCGLNHALMTFPIRVVPEAEYEAWVAEQTGEAN